MHVERSLVCDFDIAVQHISHFTSGTNPRVSKKKRLVYIYVCVCVCVCVLSIRFQTFLYRHLNCRRFLKIDYVFAVHRMR